MTNNIIKSTILPQSKRLYLHLITVILVYSFIPTIFITVFQLQNNVLTSFSFTFLNSYLMSVLSLTLIYLGYKSIYYKFSRIEVKNNHLNIIDLSYFPQINKTIDLSEVISLEIIKQETSKWLKLLPLFRSYFPQLSDEIIFLMKIKSKTDIQKIPIIGWRESDINKLVDYLEGKYPSIKIIKSHTISYTGAV